VITAMIVFLTFLGLGMTGI